MASYDAQIRLGVQGLDKLRQARKEIASVSLAIDQANEGRNKRLIDNYANRIKELNRQRQSAARSFDRVQIGSSEELGAARAYANRLQKINSLEERRSLILKKALQSANLRYRQQLGSGVNQRDPIVQQERNALAIRLKAERSLQRELRLRKQSAAEAERLMKAESKKKTPLFSGNRKDAILSGVMGGAFPLLFGQGAGTSLGGAAGGYVGGMMGNTGGMALGIAGSAAGQAFDTLMANAVGLADALKAPSEALVAMEASGIKVSSALKNTVDALENTGRAAEAQAMVLAELERLGGADYVQNLLELEEANKALQTEWSQLSVTIQKELLPAFILLTNGVAGFARFVNENKGAFDFLATLTKSAVAATGLGAVPALIGEAGGLQRRTRLAIARRHLLTTLANARHWMKPLHGRRKRRICGGVVRIWSVQVRTSAVTRKSKSSSYARKRQTSSVKLLIIAASKRTSCLHESRKSVKSALALKSRLPITALRHLKRLIVNLLLAT